MAILLIKYLNDKIITEQLVKKYYSIKDKENWYVKKYINYTNIKKYSSLNIIKM